MKADEMTAEEFTAMQAKRAKRGQWKAKRTDYGGRRYPSIAEAEMAARLDAQFSPQCGWGWWAPQVLIHLDGDRWFRVDFVVCTGAKGTYAIEVKGRETAAWRQNRAAWMRHGPFPLHVVKGGATVEVIGGPNA